MRCHRKPRMLHVWGCVSQSTKWGLSHIFAVLLAYQCWWRIVGCRDGISMTSNHGHCGEPHQRQPFSCLHWRLHKLPHSCQLPRLGHGIFYIWQVIYMHGWCFHQSCQQRIWVWCASDNGMEYLILQKPDVNDRSCHLCKFENHHSWWIHRQPKVSPADESNFGLLFQWLSKTRATKTGRTQLLRKTCALHDVLIIHQWYPSCVLELLVRHR